MAHQMTKQEARDLYSSLEGVSDQCLSVLEAFDDEEEMKLPAADDDTRERLRKLYGVVARLVTSVRAILEDMETQPRPNVQWVAGEGFYPDGTYHNAEGDC